MSLLNIEDFDFDLPTSQIAQYPLPTRTQSRLLVVGDGRGSTYQLEFSDLLNLLCEGDLVVCNDTKVIPARLYGYKSTGGRVELLIERIVGDRTILAQAKARRPLKTSDTVTVDGQFKLIVQGRNRNFFVLDLVSETTAQELVQNCGTVPLPPYIKRSAVQFDSDRYQCVYATHDGSVAAPTAGLHFSANLLQKMDSKGIEISYITLHVGAGTFAPIRSSNLDNHVLHCERYVVSESVVNAVKQAKQRGSRIVAVGTTVLRALESASRSGKLETSSGETDLFITPGFEFQTVDALITNFHLPRSSLIMLVCAFGGTERVLEAYRLAIREGFRFYSYGDAMFLAPQ